jgi:hypothetical protein
MPVAKQDASDPAPEKRPKEDKKGERHSKLLAQRRNEIIAWNQQLKEAAVAASSGAGGTTEFSAV